jgi:ABC transporter substrate binding protein
MGRRAFIVGGVAIVALPSAVAAQSAGKVYRIGYLTQGTVMDGSATDRRILGAFTDGLRQLGYVDGQNLRMEWREARGDNSWLPALAEELVRLKPDVIVTISSPPTEAVRQATTTIQSWGSPWATPLGTASRRPLLAPEATSPDLRA